MTKFLLVVAIVAMFFIFLQYTSGNKKAAAENRQKGMDFLAANKSEEGVETTASGLQYKVLEEGTGH